MTDLPRPHHDAPRLLAGTRPDEHVLVKGDLKFTFVCEPGGEAELLADLRAKVHDPDSELTWFDAAVVSHAVGQRLKARLTTPPADRRARRSA